MPFLSSRYNYRYNYVIWEPASNRVIGQEENWTKRQAEQFLRDHKSEFTPSAHVTVDLWNLESNHV